MGKLQSCEEKGKKKEHRMEGTENKRRMGEQKHDRNVSCFLSAFRECVSMSSVYLRERVRETVREREKEGQKNMTTPTFLFPNANQGA